MKHTYAVNVGNIGNIDCETRKEAGTIFREYCDLSKQGYGRAAYEPVSLLVDGEPVKEYDPYQVVCRKGSFKERVWNILKEFASPDEFVKFDLVSYGLIKNREGGWEVNDAHFMCTGLEAHQALHAICARYETWKANYLPGARVKDLENVSDSESPPMLEVRGIPFMEVRIS